MATYEAQKQSTMPTKGESRVETKKNFEGSPSEVDSRTADFQAIGRPSTPRF